LHGHGHGDLSHRVPGSVARFNLPAAPKLTGHIAQKLVALLGQELCRGRPERREFSVVEAEDR
jgi:hypothetical protein